MVDKGHLVIGKKSLHKIAYAMFFPIENNTVGKMIPDNFQRLASKCGFASVLLTNCDLFEP